MTDGTPEQTARGPWTSRKKVIFLLLLAVAGVILLALACWVWSARGIDAQIAAELARYRAAGQPVDFADFDFPPVPDEENAAKLYMDAAKALMIEGGLEEEVLGWRSAIAPEEMDLAKAILDRNTEALALCRRARAMEKVDWQWRVGPMSGGAAVNYLRLSRRLGGLLVLAGAYHHRIGDDAAAMEYIRDAIALADALDEGPSVTHHLTSISVAGLQIAAVEDILPDLRVSAGAGEAALRGGMPGQAAGRKQIEELIACLLDEAPRIARIQRAYYAERAMYAYWITDASRVRRGPWWWFRYGLARPIFRRGMLRAIKMYTALAEAAGRNDYHAAIPSVTYEEWRLEQLLSAVVPDIAAMIGSSMRTALKLDYQTKVRSRLAVVALAMKLYEADHGRLIENLAELVPDYLPAVPVDPFDPNGGPVRYAPSARWPVLYSLGPNGTDEGGAHGPDVESWRWQYDNYDIAFFVTDKRPPMPGSSQSVTAPGATQPAGASGPSGPGPERGPSAGPSPTAGPQGD